MILLPLTILAWFVTFGYMAPAFSRLFGGGQYRGDSARRVCFAFALLQLGFLIRRAIADEPADQAFAVLLCGSIGVAVLTLAAAWSYGRGDRVA